MASKPYRLVSGNVSTKTITLSPPSVARVAEPEVAHVDVEVKPKKVKAVPVPESVVPESAEQIVAADEAPTADES